MEAEKKGAGASKRIDLGPHVGRPEGAHSVRADQLGCVIPLYDERHSLYNKHLQEASRYEADNPRIVALVNNLDEVGLIEPGVIRRNGLWGARDPLGCPACREQARTGWAEAKREGDPKTAAMNCPVLELVCGNRRFRALVLLNAQRREVGAGQPALPFLFQHKALKDTQATAMIASENNIREGNSPIDQIRQAVFYHGQDPTSSVIKTCFDGVSFGRFNMEQLVPTLALCEEPVWEAFAKKLLRKDQLEALAEVERSQQAQALRAVLSREKPVRSPPKPRLSEESRKAVLSLFDDVAFLATYRGRLPADQAAQLDKAIDELKLGAG